MRELFGLAALNAVHLAVGASLLFGLGIRRPHELLRFAGLALVTGWVAVGLAASYALMLGSGLLVLHVLALAAVVAACGLLASRVVAPLVRRPQRFATGRAERLAAGAGAFVLVAYLEVLFLRARLAEPSRWDTWAFWMPKAKSIVHFDGLDTGPGGFTSFANPDYPPLKPAVDAVALRFLWRDDAGALAVQNWVVAAAFFAALAALLADRVRPAILWPSLALVALLPDFGVLVGSLLADEAMMLLFALAGTCGGLWLVGREVRHAALAAFFLAASALVKNEGLMLAVVLFVLLCAVTRPRRWRHLVPLVALPIVALVPWRLWMGANGIPETSAFRLGDLSRPAFLLDRSDRLGTALQELPPMLVDPERWLLTVPALIVVAAATLGRRPALAIYAVGMLVLGVLGFAVVYWASTYPLRWYIDTTADRLLPSLAVCGAVLLPLLVSETLAASRYPASCRARSSAVRAADS
jgi:hypothetical protein